LSLVADSIREMVYERAIEFLYGLRLFGAKLGLENTRKLAEMAGNPHERLRFIHVAGTNGKGSTCAMLESIYRAQGLKVGSFTSPHLVSFRERIQVNRQLIPENEVVRLVQRMQERLPKFSRQFHPTFFEVVTVMALEWFAEEKCELVILETGLGGRLDATNIVTPLASVITNIDYDHQQWLGETIEKIAMEKAGIIKPGVPVVTAARLGKGLEVIQAKAHQCGSTLRIVTENDSLSPPLDRMSLPLPGHYQKENAATALATVQTLAKEIPVSEAAIFQGLRDVQWAGRMQMVQLASGQRILLDGAHNAMGARLLFDQASEFFPKCKPALILAILGDKDWQAMAQAMAPMSNRILLPRLKSERALAPERLQEACVSTNPRANVSTASSLQEALDQVKDEPGVVITGSLYLIGEAMECLRLSAVPNVSESGLNEYGAKT
jgi:dihydrofolate synthase/folylpolyglutamate synthase